MDDSFHIEKGLLIARSLLIKLATLLPAATEALDPYNTSVHWWTYCMVGDWARTTESQTHREMASGLSMPVGFKTAPMVAFK